jgi:hypothetical protein
MDEYRKSQFFHIAEQHATALSVVRHRRTDLVKDRGCMTRPTLDQAAAQETKARRDLIRWQPGTIVEAQTKLLYMIAYLVRTKTALRQDELEDALDSIRHLL